MFLALWHRKLRYYKVIKPDAFNDLAGTFIPHEKQIHAWLYDASCYEEQNRKRTTRNTLVSNTYSSLSYSRESRDALRDVRGDVLGVDWGDILGEVHLKTREYVGGEVLRNGRVDGRGDVRRVDRGEVFGDVRREGLGDVRGEIFCEGPGDVRGETRGDVRGLTRGEDRGLALGLFWLQRPITIMFPIQLHLGTRLPRLEVGILWEIIIFLQKVSVYLHGNDA